jgi:hypothetical protein
MNELKAINHQNMPAGGTQANEEKTYVGQQRRIQDPPRIQQQAHGHACMHKQTNRPSGGAFDCRLVGCVQEPSA